MFLQFYQNYEIRFLELKNIIFSDRFYTNPTIGTKFLKADCFFIETIMNNRKRLPKQIKN